MTAHPFADIFPLLSSAEVLALADDITANGQREPIWLYNGKVLDGRNRLAACKLAGVEPKVKEFKGAPEEAVRLIWSLNFKRRHLTPSQAGACVVEFEDLLATVTAQAKAVQHAQAGRGKEGGRGKKKPLASQDAKGLRAPKTAEKLARQVGVSQATVERARALQKSSPEKLKEVKAGTITLSQATRELKQVVSREHSDLPEAKYRVLYADPPWAYTDKADDGAVQSGGVARHYPTMTIQALCDLGVRAICDDDAVLFLWVTSPLLFEAGPVIKAWGFRYTASFIWDKIKHNMGHYNSVRHEFLLVCVRGSCTPDVKTLFDSVQAIEKTGHSVKPERFREIIDTLYPHGKRIELFARRRANGWDVWGDEIATEA